MNIEDPAGFLRETAERIRRCVAALKNEMVTNKYWHGDHPHQSDAAYREGVDGGLGGMGGLMASQWTPSVALAVAEWLDHASNYVPPDPHAEDEACPDCAHVVRALAVAKAYRRAG